MPWQIPVVLRVVIAYGVTSILFKYIVGLPSRTRRLRAQFLFCGMFAVAVLFASRTRLVPDIRFFLIVGLGFANSLAAYAQWRAVDLSLSRTALFTFMDDVISMALAAVFLAEHRIFTPLLGIGIVLCFAAAIVNARLESRAKASTETNRASRRIFLWIGIYSLIWGVAGFAFRAAAVSGLPLPAFLVAWYGGAYLGSNIVMFLAGKKEMGASLTWRGIAAVSLLSLSVFLSLGLTYWVNMEAPVTVTQPIFQVAEMVIPALIGLYVFKEIKEYGGAKKLVFAIAFIGSLVVAFSY